MGSTVPADHTTSPIVRAKATTDVTNPQMSFGLSSKHSMINILRYIFIIIVL
jgi:hypothetical protein